MSRLNAVIVDRISFGEGVTIDDIVRIIDGIIGENDLSINMKYWVDLLIPDPDKDFLNDHKFAVREWKPRFKLCRCGQLHTSTPGALHIDISMLLFECLFRHDTVILISGNNNDILKETIAKAKNFAFRDSSLIISDLTKVEVKLYQGCKDIYSIIHEPKGGAVLIIDGTYLINCLPNYMRTNLTHILNYLIENIENELEKEFNKCYFLNAASIDDKLVHSNGKIDVILHQSELMKCGECFTPPGAFDVNISMLMLMSTRNYDDIGLLVGNVDLLRTVKYLKEDKTMPRHLKLHVICSSSSHKKNLIFPYSDTWIELADMLTNVQIDPNHPNRKTREQTCH